MTNKECCAPPTIEEILEAEIGQALLMREKPGRVASNSEAEVVLGDIQGSLRAKK